MTATSIVGICLVRNEERFLERVLASATGFCDRLLIADHQSTDGTLAIAEGWAKEHDSVSVQSIRHPKESHEMLCEFVNTPTWVFAIDGDELYDAHGLAQLKENLLAGSYNQYWRIIGNVLNCVDLDFETGQASGYLSPPSRSITKLYNFNAIDNWTGVTGERLHGGTISFKEGYRETSIFRLHEQCSWEESVFRCLHLCFLPRSSKDRRSHAGTVTRWNLAEQQSRGLVMLGMANFLNRCGISLSSRWKIQRYGRGSIVTKDIRSFVSTAVGKDMEKNLR